MFYHINRKQAKTEVGVRRGLFQWHMWPCGILEERGRLWDFRLAEQSNALNMSIHLGRILEDSSAESYVNRGGPDQKNSDSVSATGPKTILVVFWQRMWLCFCLCCKNLPKLKRNGIVYPVKIFFKLNIDSIVWLLVINQKPNTKYTVKREKGTRNLILEWRLMLKETRKLMKGLFQTGI